MNLNQVTIAGRLTRDPLLRTLPAGSKVAEFGLAINEKYTDKTGKQVEQTCFVEIVTWAKSAEIASNYLHKGDRLLLEGVLSYDSWMTENGDKRNRLRVTAKRLHLVGGRRNADQNGGEAESMSAFDDVDDDDNLPI